jgi:hypothetical protein
MRRFLVFAPVFPWALGAATLVLNVVATWRSDSFVLVKLLTNVTADPFLAAWWPVTWAVWSVQLFLGYPTPLDVVLV